MSLRLNMDHHVDIRITSGLRQRRIDVLTAFEDGHDRHSDQDILRRATEQERAIFTFDSDFLVIAEIWRAAEKRFAGAIFGRSRTLSIGDSIRDLELIVEAISPSEIENSIIWIPL